MKWIKMVFVLLAVFPSIARGQKNISDSIWFKPIGFNVPSFVSPDLVYGPFTRWWWPGNDVNKEELKRELRVFSSNHFGGVEIQPFALVFPTKGAGRAERIMGYDSPEYYDNLRFVLETAMKEGLIVDLTDGSGWPGGGSHISKADNNLTLEYGIIDIPENSTSAIAVPNPIRGDDSSRKLIALLLIKTVKDSTTGDNSIVLDPDKIINITSQIQGGHFKYKVNGKDWKAIAFWAVPTMETPMIIAKRDAGFVFNHFDSSRVLKNFNYLFGDRTGLKPFFGKSLRAIFDDSYEFKANRHFSGDFIREFKIRRGYDITPYLPANMWYGYNNMYARMGKPGMKPDFVFTDEDWRLRYDYDLTLGDLLGSNFLKPTMTWTESKGLLHRTQPYGFNMDIMASAGLSSIPELESMLFAKGSEMGFKLISSGAHLYNRPVVSSETAVYFKRAFMTTPQKLKMTIDKALSCGVNQIIYHGTPYKYFPDAYPKEGWYPFFNSGLDINFSSDLNENNPFWKYINTINQYVQRSQYVLRCGKPHTDVLIYYPFLNYSEEVANPREVLVAGYMPGSEPPLPEENKNVPYNRTIDTEWLEKIISLIDQLNARGITWDWVNDASIQQIKLDATRQLNVRGNTYQSIILFELPYIQLESAKNLKNLASKGANILAVGEMPHIQPGYFEFRKRDKLTEQLMKAVLSGPSVTQLKNLDQLEQWRNNLYIPFAYSLKCDAFRQVRRKLGEKKFVQFIWNESGQWQSLSLKIKPEFHHNYWMDATDGSMFPAKIENGCYAYKLPPYGSIFFLTTDPPEDIVSTQNIQFDPSKAQSIANIPNWKITMDSIQLNESLLFDWKNNNQLKFNSKPVTYSSHFAIDHLDNKARYYLDMGTVYYSADVLINGKSAGSSVFSPFILDITSLLREGENDIVIVVTNAMYNSYVGQANNGDRLFKKLKDTETMSAGLLGPVRIYLQR